MNVRLRMVNTLSSSAVQFESFAKGHEFPGPPAKGPRRWGGFARAARATKM